MKTLRNSWFIGFVLTWAVLILCRKKEIHLPHFVNNYLGDLLAVPVISQLGLWFLRMVSRNPFMHLKCGHILFIVIYVTLVFELFLPSYSTRYTADGWDVVCYLLGGFFYAKVMNR